MCRIKITPKDAKAHLQKGEKLMIVLDPSLCPYTRMDVRAKLQMFLADPKENFVLIGKGLVGFIWVNPKDVCIK
jgi:hypothetical protein